ncbi:MAG TPA: hypothetical protein VER98_06120 [Terriglobia bacterium]|nr:hypothetical protein [Terriglobia bacterium]
MNEVTGEPAFATLHPVRQPLEQLFLFAFADKIAMIQQAVVAKVLINIPMFQQGAGSMVIQFPTLSRQPWCLPMIAMMVRSMGLPASCRIEGESRKESMIRSLRCSALATAPLL